MSITQYQAEDRLKSAEMVADILDSWLAACLRMSDELDSIPMETNPKHWESIADEMATFKKSLYPLNEAGIKARNKNAQYILDQRRVIKESAEFEAETGRDNEPEFSAIADQIQRAMASLDTGDHAIIVVRKESDTATEEVDGTEVQRLSDIIRIMQKNTS